MRLAIPMTVLVVCSAVSLGCGAGGAPEPARPEGVSPETAAERSEAAATRQLEEQAADFEDRFRAIQESDSSPEEKAAEASRLADEQQRALRAAADGEATTGEGEDQP